MDDLRGYPDFRKPPYDICNLQVPGKKIFYAQENAEKKGLKH
jgi:hypothetical protein